MYLLVSCTVSWLCLVCVFIATSIGLPAPRSTTDLVVIIVVGAAAVLSTRLGAVSLLTLVIRLLPNGHMRTMITRAVLRIVPTVLRSSVIAAASVSLAVHTAHAAPPSDDPLTSALDPGWPTAVASESPLDPAWPVTPPTDDPEDAHTDTDEPGDDDLDIHVVGAGESLWSIAMNRPTSDSGVDDIVDEIYAANREVIGANPNLIMPGQRLEIQL